MDAGYKKGVALMIWSNVAFCAMACLIKSASGIDSFKTALFRFVIGFAILGTAALIGKIKLEFIHGPLLFLRGLTGGFAVLLFFLSIAKLGIGKGSVISYAYPIFACVISCLFLKERVPFVKWLAITTALAGMCLLSMGGADGASSFSNFGVYDALAVLGAVLSGVAVVLVKKLHNTDSTYAIFFSQCVIGVWVVVIPANLVPCSIGYSGGVILLLIGISAAVGQLLMTEGYRHLPVTAGSLLSLVLPVLNFIIGILFFHEPLSSLAILGAVVIVVSCAVVIVPNEKLAMSFSPSDR